jgi:hypothetical protein
VYARILDKTGKNRSLSQQAGSGRWGFRDFMLDEESVHYLCRMFPAPGHFFVSVGPNLLEAESLFGNVGNPLGKIGINDSI